MRYSHFEHKTIPMINILIDSHVRMQSHRRWSSFYLAGVRPVQITGLTTVSLRSCVENQKLLESATATSQSSAITSICTNTVISQAL